MGNFERGLCLKPNCPVGFSFCSEICMNCRFNPDKIDYEKEKKFNC